MAIDPALLAAVKSSRKQAEADLSHKRQLRRNAARTRSALKVQAARSESNKQLIEARASGQEQVIKARESALATRRQSQRKEQRTEKIQSAAVGAGVSTVKGAAHAATLGSDVNLFLVVIMMIAMLAVFYNVVTGAERFAGFMGSMGDLLHKVSSTTPLFKAVAK